MDNLNNKDISKDLEKSAIKKYKKATVGLSVLSIILALCLVISLSYNAGLKAGMEEMLEEAKDTLGSMEAGGNAGSEGSLSGSEGKETEGSDESVGNFVGTASEKKMGDYTAAKDYEEIYDYLKDAYKERNGLFTGGIMYKEDLAVEEETAEADTAATSGAMAERPMEAGTGSGGEFSSTNIMTTGVDEADISKTDGKFIYNATGSEILIFKIGEGKSELINKFTPEFKAPSDVIREIFLDENLLLIVTEHIEFREGEDKNSTKVLIYDISNVEAPVLSGSYTQDGTFHTARKVGDIVYLFTDNYLKEPEDKKNKATRDEGLSSWLPLVNEKVVSADCIYLPGAGTNSLIISSFDQKNPDKSLDAKIIVNNYTQVYVGNSGIYLYNSVYSGNRDVLKLSRISYLDGSIKTGESTSVRGYLNDNFAINENEGYLRLVTTEWLDGISNTLYVIDENMKECGRINNIALGEQLYACRFLGDIGYFVTFEQTDPLFTVDLSDPKNPEIIGELKIPGFSEYLHFWGEDKLLGIGYETNDDGQRRGLKLSMFDISDPSGVSEESKFVIKDGDYAPGFYNYKAILAYEKGNVFGFAYNDYDKNRSFYEFYEYAEGGFNKLVSEEIKNDLAARARGHFANGYLYLSMDTEVLAYER